MSTCNRFDVAGCVTAVCEPNPCTDLYRNTCEPSGVSFVCRCNEGFVEEEERCVNVDAALCPSSHLIGDSFEPDECAEAATLLASGATQRHTMAPDGDVDWFVFDSLARTLHRIGVQWTTSGGTAVVEVLDGDFVTVTGGDVDVAAMESVLFHEPERGGLLYVRVTGDRDYEIAMRYVADDHGDEPVTATPVSSSTPMPGFLEYDQDADWFVLDCGVGDVLVVDVVPAASFFIDLVGPDGVQTLRTDRAPVTHRCTVAGRHYARVTGAPDIPYTVTLELSLDGWPDVCQPGVPAIAATGEFQGLLEFADDRDCGSFIATNETIYRFDVDADPPVRWAVQRADQTFSDVVDSSVATRALRLAGGTTCVCVDGASRDGVAFLVGVSSLGADDHGDNAATATPVALRGEAASFALNFVGDVDFFVVGGLPAGHHVSVAALTTEGETHVASQGFDPGALLQGLFRRVYDDAPLYVRLDESKLSGSGRLVLSDLGVDDFGDDDAHAEVLSLEGNPAAGTLPSYDIDWFSVTPVQTGQRTLFIDSNAPVRLTRYARTALGLTPLEPPLVLQPAADPSEITALWNAGETTWLTLELATGSTPAAYSVRIATF
jgi:hypothetical protein